MLTDISAEMQVLGGRKPEAEFYELQTLAGIRIVFLWEKRCLRCMK